MVVSYQTFGQIYPSHLQKSSCPISHLVQLDPWRWDRLVLAKRRYETTILYYFFWTAWPLNMGPVGCPERSVRHCHSTSTRPGEDVIWILWKWNVHCHWRNSPPSGWARWMQPKFLQFVDLRLTLMLSSHLRLDLPFGLSLSGTVLT